MPSDDREPTERFHGAQLAAKFERACDAAGTDGKRAWERYLKELTHRQSLWNWRG